MRQGREVLMPILTRTGGFVAHYVLQVGRGEIVSVGIFEDQAGADESTEKVLERIGQGDLARVFPKPQVSSGEVVLQTTR
jgi:hypothetical protein